MSYLLLDSIAVLWLTHGVPQIVLQIGIQNHLHSSLEYISPSQFVNDVNWLFGAIQQSIIGRGRSIVMQHAATQDGILAWKQLLATFRYDGDVDCYLAKQQEVLMIHFHSGYPGGEIQFLEDYESDFLNIEFVMRTNNISDSTSLYTDDGKRRLFVQQFSVPNLTADLIDTVESTTETWEAMVQIVELMNQHFPLGSGGCATIMPLLSHCLLIKAINHKLKELSKEEVRLL